MAIPALDETTIGVTAFKAQCLSLIDDVAKGRTSRVVLLKHDKPVALVVPFESEENTPGVPDDLWGAMKGTVTISPGVDLTEPIDVEWDALR